MQVRGVLVIVVIAVAIMSVTGIRSGGGDAPAASAQEEAESPHTVLYSTQLCTVLLSGFQNVDAASALFSCSAPNTALLIKTLAGWLTQSDGEDTPIFDPALDDPFTPEIEGRIDEPCVADTNGDGVICGPGDQGVDDAAEVGALIDLRDDGLLDGVYRIRGEDFASIDLEANQLHELDGLLWLLTFPEDDRPIRFTTSAGVLEPGTGMGAASVNCGDTLALPQEFFEEDCDDDGIAEDGVVAVRLRPNGANRGPGQIVVTEDSGETVVDFTVVGELDNIAFTLLETSVQAGTASEDCRLEPSADGIAAALADPYLAVVIVRALDGDDTPITGALLDWEIADPDIAFPFLLTTPTLDLGPLGNGFPQAICGGVPGVTTVTASTAEISSVLDPRAEQEEESFDITVVDPPPEPANTSTPTSTHTSTPTGTHTATPESTNTVAARTDTPGGAAATATSTRTSAAMATSTVAPVSEVVGVVAAPTARSGRVLPDAGVRALSDWPGLVTALCLAVAAVGVATVAMGLRRERKS
jgi:hypothetical protein